MTATEFETQVMPLRDKMCRFAATIVCSETEAEDTVSDVLEKLWSRHEALGECRSVEAFAMTALRNRCYDVLRTRHPKVELQESTLSVAAAAESRETVAMVRRAMAALPVKQREVLHLKDIEGYSTADIAEMYDTDQAQVRVILSRARCAMRDELLKLM